MLPKIDVPIYQITLPLLKKTYNFRPFLVKEEKLLLMALEAQDEKSTILAIKQIINNCCLDEIDVDNLPIVDLEYFFLNLRARSVGEEIDLEYKCNNFIDDDAHGTTKKCGNVVKINVNLLEIAPKVEENHTNKIYITDSIGMVMKYPSFKSTESIDTSSGAEASLKLIINCIDCIFDKETIYYSRDMPVIEMIEFIEGLTKSQFKKIEEFFSSIPKIKVNLKFHCSKCGYKEDINLEGIQSFLA